jgi:hypothetical protein
MMITAETIKELYIPINLSDPVISGFLRKYPEAEHVGRLTEALYVGITALQSSIAKIIEANNREILKQFSLVEENSSIKKLQSNLSKQFEEFFQKSVSSSIPDYKIVIEAKNSEVYNLEKAKKELEQAKENREADIGIFILKKGKEPSIINDFYRSGSDYFIILDVDSLALGNKPLYLDASIKIAQLSAIVLKRENLQTDIETKLIEINLSEINDQIKLLIQIKSKSTTIENNGNGFVRS